jgi:membrane glycosyltransferase
LVSRGRLVTAMASAALLLLVMLPRTAWSPQSPSMLDDAHAGWIEIGAPPQIETAQIEAPPLRLTDAGPQRPQRGPRYRPASKIDDEIRRRAYEAVARSLETEAS